MKTVFYRLKITSDTFKNTLYRLKITSDILKIVFYILKIISYKLKTTLYSLEITSDILKTILYRQNTASNIEEIVDNGKKMQNVPHTFQSVDGFTQKIPANKLHLSGLKRCINRFLSVGYSVGFRYVIDVFITASA